MTQPAHWPKDPLIDEVRGRREDLVRKYGGLRGWVEHLRQLQAQRPERLVKRRPPDT